MTTMVKPKGMARPKRVYYKGEQVPSTRYKLTVSQRELDTIIAALRLWQRDAAHIADSDGFILAISEEHGEALSVEEVDRLVERINS